MVRHGVEQGPALTPGSTRPAVSVVIPTYERVDFLRRAIRSVVEQTFGDFEIVVVDDGPNDEIARAVSGHPDPRVRLVRHDRNRGVPAARNTGIEASDGSYIAFLDDDDIWLPAKLERQLEAAAAGADVVHTLVYLADGDGNVYERGSEAGFRLFREVAAAGYPYHWLLRRSSFFINTFLVRRECIEKIGGFDEELPAVDDLDFVHRLRREYEFRLVDEPLVKYCFHGGNQGNRTPHGSWLRLAAKELAWVREHDVPERRAVEAYLHRQCAQSHWIAGDNRRAAASALRARRLDSSVIDTRTVAKYATAALLPKRLTARVRRRVAATRPAGEPWPFIDLG